MKKKTYFDDARLGKYGTSAYLFLTALNYELMLFFRFLSLKIYVSDAMTLKYPNKLRFQV